MWKWEVPCWTILHRSIPQCTQMTCDHHAHSNVCVIDFECLIGNVFLGSHRGVEGDEKIENFGEVHLYKRTPSRLDRASSISKMNTRTLFKPPKNNVHPNPTGNRLILIPVYKKIIMLLHPHSVPSAQSITKEKEVSKR